MVTESLAAIFPGQPEASTSKSVVPRTKISVPAGKGEAFLVPTYLTLLLCTALPSSR